MKFRMILGVCLAVAALAATAVVAPANADEGVDVGGGAAGVVLVAGGYGSTLRAATGIRYAEAVVSVPRVEMGRNGGNHVADITAAPEQLTDGLVKLSASLRRTAETLPFTAEVTRVSVFGNRVGTPYAQAQVDLANLRIKGQKIGLRALSVQCTWDLNGARGSLTQTSQTGNVEEIAPNTVIDLPGLGSLTLNEQYRQDILVWDGNGAAQTMNVIYVVGAHLRLTAGAQEVYGFSEAMFGFTSCDPLSLPALSGLRMVSGGASPTA